MTSLTFNYIFSYNKDKIISINNNQYIYATEDLKLFNKITSEEYCKNSINICVMGRKTWESIPDKYKPLNNRINIIITRNKLYEISANIKNKEYIYVLNNFNDIFLLHHKLTNDSQNIYSKNIGKVFIIGGLEIFNEALKYDINDTFYLGEFDQHLTDTAFLHYLYICHFYKLSFYNLIFFHYKYYYCNHTRAI